MSISYDIKIIEGPQSRLKIMENSFEIISLIVMMGSLWKNLTERCLEYFLEEKMRKFWKLTRKPTNGL